MKCPNCQHQSRQASQLPQTLFEICVRCGSMWIDYRGQTARRAGLETPRPAPPGRMSRREVRVC